MFESETVGYKNIVTIPIIALNLCVMPMMYAGIPSNSSVAVINVPNLETNEENKYI